MERVQLKGFSEVDVDQVQRVTEIANKQADKIDRCCDDFTVELHLRESAKDGNTKYGVHAHIKTPKKTYSTEVTDWDLIKSVHGALDKATAIITNEHDREESLNRHESVRKA